MKVHDIMQRTSLSLRKNDSLREAAALFRRHGVGGVQVLDAQGLPETVFTSDDLIRALAGGANLSDPVAGHARRHICAVRSDASVDDVAWYDSRFLGVVDDDADGAARVGGCVNVVGCVDVGGCMDLAGCADMAAPDCAARDLAALDCAAMDMADLDMTNLDRGGRRESSGRTVDSADASGLAAMRADAARTRTGRRAPDEGGSWASLLKRFPEPLLLCGAGGVIRWRNDAARQVLGAQCPRHATLEAALHLAGFELERDPVDPEAVALAVRDDSRYVLLRRAVPDPLGRAERLPDVGPCRLVQLRDVTEQHAMQRKLRSMDALSREFRGIFESSFDGIYITDGEGRTLLINRAYERITGIRAEEVVGRTMHELVRDGYYDRSVTLDVLKSGKCETIIQKLKRGKIIVVTGNPILDEDGRIWRVVTNVRDVTELQRLQEELEKMGALHDRYRMELDSLRKCLGRDGGIVVRSKRMRDVYEQALRLAQVDSTVLIMGESGVGKEIVAEVVHGQSPRRDQPFVRISCAAIPEQLLESELFGYVQGAFTGANKAGKPGVFELANQGSLFLDEIGELPLGLQSKLLRVLQERRVTRVGDVRSTPVDVRIMAATNRDLEAMMLQGTFRSDLYYRLNVVPLVVPPLRERREAIFDFIYRFLERYNRKYGLGRQIDPDASDYLAAFGWPGNVRQLENTIERLVVLGQGDVITREDAVRALASNSPPAGEECAEGTGAAPEGGADHSLRAVIERAEREAIRRALKTHQSTRAAARALGVNQSTIVRKARRYRLARD